MRKRKPTSSVKWEAMCTPSPHLAHHPEVQCDRHWTVLLNAKAGRGRGWRAATENEGLFQELTQTSRPKKYVQTLHCKGGMYT